MALTKRAKLPVGKMVRVKPGEVVTGYQANRDGTTSLLIEKKRRATSNPKRKAKKKRKARREGKVIAPGVKQYKSGRIVAFNPSVRKSKKYFKRAAKRLGVKLPKRVPRSLTHSRANKKRVVRKTKKR